MMEKAFRFGPEENLLGVLTEPKSPPPGSEAPAAIWLNAGFLHHVGPFGWYTQLARRLADRGVLSFRFDLSGIGESAPRGDGPWTPDCALADVTAALDFVAGKKQSRRFVLLGVCSGAVLAHHVAVRDERVVGAVMVDGYGYRTPGFYVRDYGPRLFRPQSWWTLAQRSWRKVCAGRAPVKPSLEQLSESYFFDFPPRTQARAELLNMVRRGVGYLFLYTGDQASLYFNHRRQFREMFGNLDPDGKQIEVDYMAMADHLFSAHAHRQLMFERIETWLQRFQG